MFPVIVRVGDLVEMTADRRLRLVRLRPDHRVESVLAFTDIRVTSEEIHGPGSEAEELRHPGVVVVVLREMTVGAILRCADAAGGVREVRVERLAAIALRRESLRLRVNPFAI